MIHSNKEQPLNDMHIIVFTIPCLFKIIENVINVLFFRFMTDKMEQSCTV